MSRRQSSPVPGPTPPPLVPDHLGQPSYADCAKLAVIVGLCDTFEWPLPPTISPGFAGRLREWVRREAERGHMDKLIAAVTPPGRPLGPCPKCGGSGWESFSPPTECHCRVNRKDP